MPRTTVATSKRQPIPPLNLEELKFWLRIMEEHALLIKSGLPCDNIVLINQAEVFQQEFADLRSRAEKVQSERRFAELVADTREAVADFYNYKRRLLHLVLTCQIAGCNFALFLDHVSREAEYFLILLERLSVGQPLYQVASAREAAFWLRLMADHAEFIFHRLDPSERTLVDTAEEFACHFDELYLQGRDFVSMLRGEMSEIPSFRRFLQDVRVSTIRLRDFKRAAEALAAECKLLGLIPAILADHVRREADHFLLVLSLLEKGAVVPFDEEGELEYLNLDGVAGMSAGAAQGFGEAGSCGEDACAEDFAADDGTTFEEYEEADEEDYDDDEEEPREPLVPPKPSKYKWSGKWPRPLGTVAD